MKIQGKTALITGASRGIGRAIALELAQQGMYRLILVARNAERLSEVAAEIKAMGREAIVLPLDLTQTVEVNIAIAQTWKQFGPIHLLVNCAGVAHQAPFLQTKLPKVQEELSLNLMGIYSMTYVLARRMASRQEGRIVNVSSLMGKIGAPTMATYSATKFAILGFTQALRSELAAYNIKVTALLPSLTETDMAKNTQRFRWVAAMTPEKVAKVLVSSLAKESPEVLVGWQSHLAVWGNRLAPRQLEWWLQLTAPKSLQRQLHRLEV
ncbi:MAG: SDR family NAD(P)-dependent oxidoreductase [Acaryochloris sp. RU_4_1]|nr:SDR family NAD(P)-dependent oxidoreductase [Acaryochloris sp. SU_5_25]NJM67074.1 SDR family NAD(P)-dependent oxidoreductase [Acaryochloris sp. RU_4_1]NJN39017.1 SDR family NAD(P)-dependent oxidoreductase [Acaryochloridaceae cyanobacterium CSU_3_4]NJR54720.1 SDR family NAD(P)-dependent oxidoreductase [Acaryochloris sp. CRU_2_0]